MKQYSKPVVSIDNGLAEGVYAASGAGCYEASASSSRHHRQAEEITEFR